MDITTWAVLTADGRTVTDRTLEHRDHIAAIVAYNCALQGIEPLPVEIGEGEYLLSIRESNGITYDCHWHQLRANRELVPVDQDDVLDRFAQHLVADIETALL